MAVKAKAPAKKETPAKAAAAKTATATKKAPVKKKFSQGQSLACKVCGFSITIDEVGDEIVEEETVLLCCGKPMKEKATAKKTASKATKKAAKK